MTKTEQKAFKESRLHVPAKVLAHMPYDIILFRDIRTRKFRATARWIDDKHPGYPFVVPGTFNDSVSDALRALADAIESAMALAEESEVPA